MPLVLKPKKKTSEIEFDIVDSLASELQCDKLFARILYNRGLTTKEDCEKFLYPDEKSLLDPRIMKNMDVLVDRIRLAREKNQNITIYGDYDVDGISATAIMVQALEKYGVNVSYYIPDRHTEGYGLNDNALCNIFNGNCDLLITVDCGIASCELIEKHMNLNHEIIVTDHHTIGQNIPLCTVVKPGQPGDLYENTELCGAGIAFKIAEALLGAEAEDFIDYAAVATVADVVPLKGENRYIVKKGLERLNNNPRDCFKAIFEASDFSGEVNAQTIGFVIAPRLNAAGRMESAETSFKLLMSSGAEARKLADTLCQYNLKRQETEKYILEEAEKQIKDKLLIRKYKALVLGGKNWDDGVVGICASRLAEKYRRPCIMLTIDDSGMAKGSGRSIDGIDLYEMLASASDLLVQFGGHKMAAGMSIKEENIEAFTIRLNEFLMQFEQVLFYPIASYDTKAKIEEINADFCKKIELFQPCGSENPEVTLRIDGCVPTGIKKIGAQKNHLKMLLQDETAKAGAIVFNFEKHNADYLNLASGTAIVRPEINLWQGTENVNLKVLDFKEGENIKPRQRAEELTAYFYSRLAIPKTGKAKVNVIDEAEELHYMISEWDDEDISGTLILCDLPEYCAGCVQMLENEAPRFDVSMYKPLNENCGYNGLIMGANIEKIDFTPYKRVIIYDMLNHGFADSIFEKAPWLQIYSLKCGLDLFDTIFEEYKQIDRDNMMLAYRAIGQHQGNYETELEFFKAVAEKRQVPMPITAVATHVFEELGFVSISRGTEFKITLNRDIQKRSLDESKFYVNLLKCVSSRSDT